MSFLPEGTGKIIILNLAFLGIGVYEDFECIFALSEIFHRIRDRSVDLPEVLGSYPDAPGRRRRIEDEVFLYKDLLIHVDRDICISESEWGNRTNLASDDSVDFVLRRESNILASEFMLEIPRLDALAPIRRHQMESAFAVEDDVLAPESFKRSLAPVSFGFLAGVALGMCYLHRNDSLLLDNSQYVVVITLHKA